MQVAPQQGYNVITHVSVDFNFFMLMSFTLCHHIDVIYQELTA